MYQEQQPANSSQILSVAFFSYDLKAMSDFL